MLDLAGLDPRTPLIGWLAGTKSAINNQNINSNCVSWALHVRTFHRFSRYYSLFSQHFNLFYRNISLLLQQNTVTPVVDTRPPWTFPYEPFSAELPDGDFLGYFVIEPAESSSRTTFQIEWPATVKGSPLSEPLIVLHLYRNMISQTNKDIDPFFDFYLTSATKTDDGDAEEVKSVHIIDTVFKGIPLMKALSDPSPELHEWRRLAEARLRSPFGSGCISEYSQYLERYKRRLAQQRKDLLSAEIAALYASQAHLKWLLAERLGELEHDWRERRAQKNKEFSDVEQSTNQNDSSNETLQSRCSRHRFYTLLAQVLSKETFAVLNDLTAVTNQNLASYDKLSLTCKFSGKTTSGNVIQGQIQQHSSSDCSLQPPATSEKKASLGKKRPRKGASQVIDDKLVIKKMVIDAKSDTNLFVIKEETISDHPTTSDVLAKTETNAETVIEAQLKPPLPLDASTAAIS